MKANITELKRLSNLADWHAAVSNFETTSEWTDEPPSTARSLACKIYAGLSSKFRVEFGLDEAPAVKSDNATWGRDNGVCHRDQKKWQETDDC